MADRSERVGELRALRNRAPDFWARVALANLVLAVVLLGCAGTLAWPMAWVYLAIAWTSGLAGAVALRVADAMEAQAPEARNAAGTRAADARLALAGRLLPLAVLACAGLEQRWQGSEPIGSLAVFAAFAAAASAALVNWAMAANPFFARTGAPAADHRVIAGGPYAWVRHPACAGLVVHALAVPFVLASHWALVPTAALVLATLWRSVREDRALLAELDGYAEYAERVPRRFA